MNKVAVICTYRPHPGKESQLQELLKTHVPLLRQHGLASNRSVVFLRSMHDGTCVEIFEWSSPEASGRAHENPAVNELWARMEAVADFLPLNSLREAERPFAHLELVEEAEMFQR